MYSSGGRGEEGDCWRIWGIAAKEGTGGRGTVFSLSVVATGSEGSAVGRVGSGDFCGRAESSFEGRMTGAAGIETGGLSGGGAFGVGNSLCTILVQVSDRGCTRSRRDAHTSCSFCRIFSNTRGHSDLSSCVRKRNACDGGTRYATHISMEPSRAACSRISSLVNMAVSCCVGKCYRRMASWGDKRRSRNGRMFQTWLTWRCQDCHRISSSCM